MNAMPADTQELYQNLVRSFPQISDVVIAELVSQHGNNPAQCVAFLEKRMQKMRSLENPVFAPPDERYYAWNRRGSGRGSYVIRRRGGPDGMSPGPAATAMRPSLHLEMPGRSFSDEEPPLNSPSALPRETTGAGDSQGHGPRNERAESSPGPPGTPRSALTLKFPNQAAASRSRSPMSIQVVTPTSTSIGLSHGMARRQSIGSPLAHPLGRMAPAPRLPHSSTTGQISSATNRTMPPLSINTVDYPLEEFPPRQGSTVFDTPSPSTPGSDWPNPTRKISISFSPGLSGGSAPTPISISERLRLQTEKKNLLEELLKSSQSRVQELRSDVSQMELPPSLLSSLSSGNITQGALQAVHEESRRLQAEVNAMVSRLRAASAEPAKKKSIDEGGWNCYVCTFLNHPALQRCEMCELPRAKVIAGLHVERPGEVSEEGWEIVPRLTALSPSVFR